MTEPVEVPAGPLLLRPWRAGDAPAVLAALTDPATRVWSNPGRVATLDDARWWVARQGFEGLMKGEASVFAGSVASKAMGRLSALTPGNVAAKLNRKMTEPGSGGS